MTADVQEIAGQRCLVLDAGHPVVPDARGASDLIGEALSRRTSVIVVAAEGLDASFFQLRSGLAGEVLQKAANYRLKFVVVGDIAADVAASDALRDLVIESNRGHSIFFAPDLPAVAEWLDASGP